MFPPLNAVDAEDRLLAMPVGARDKERRRRESGPVFTDIWLCFGLRCAVSQPSLQSSLSNTRLNCYSRTLRYYTKLNATETKA